PHRPELAAVGQRLNPEQLRTMALNATALITAAAATEYQHYVKVREELHHPARSASGRGVEEPGSTGLATALGKAGASGAGVGAVAAVLTPVLAGTATVLFLLVGYLLKMVTPEPAFAQTMLTAGWVLGGVTAASLLVAFVALVITALRNQPPPLEAGPYGEQSTEVRLARQAWRDALLERGILPFLREALADPGGAARHSAPPSPASRIPDLGYGRPGFTTSGDAAPGPRPSYTSPDYSSPDFGGPEHRPE
ncbi:hypothetical protein, partial [Streptomyces resistomycificus]|uniref:hypothetical protein n=1 Tax=Streptomyces resistomycificus TaxID=67356 RepID=UPI0004ABCDAF